MELHRKILIGLPFIIFDRFSIFTAVINKASQQGNRGDMRKIHVTRQFFEVSGLHGDLIEKLKSPFLDKVNGSMCAEFQVCIVFSAARRCDTHKLLHTYTHIQVKLGISSTDCSPHVDFKKTFYRAWGRKLT